MLWNYCVCIPFCAVGVGSAGAGVNKERSRQRRHQKSSSICVLFVILEKPLTIGFNEDLFTREHPCSTVCVFDDMKKGLVIQ